MSARSQSLSVHIWIPIAAIALVAVSGGTAQAQDSTRELCVTCEEPFAVYRCAFEDQSQMFAASRGAPLVCAKQLALQGQHARCSIRRDNSGPCEGERVVVIPPADAPLALTPPPGVGEYGNRAVPPGGAPDTPNAGTSIEPLPGQPADAVAAVPGSMPHEEAKPEEPDGPPKTVEELAKRTAKSSKEGLKDAGDAVAGAAKKTGETIGEAGSAIGKAAKSTWRCLSTLFSDC